MREEGSQRRGGKRKSLRMHREIMRAPEGTEIDHRNRNGVDNQKLNLRFATPGQNMANRRPRKNFSGFRGVYWASRQRRWLAQITVNSLKKYLGCFVDKTEAAKAYDRAALQYFGEFAQPNFS